MKFDLIVLSPIHIGNGEQISNWQYQIENKTVKIYSFDKVVYKLRNDKQKLINFSATIENNPLNMCLGNVLPKFNINVNPEYTLQLFGKTKNKNNEYKPIWEFIKEGKKVYIPATEIKGAIRTALFYKILKDAFTKNKNKQKQFIEEYENCARENDKKAIKKKFKDFIQKWENFAFREKDAKTDFLKNLIISDTDLKNPEEVLSVKDIIPLGVSRKFEELHEIVNRGTKFEIKIDIINSVEFKYVFPKHYKDYLNFEAIMQATSEFASKLLDEEIDYFKNAKEIEEKDKTKILENLTKWKRLAETKKYIFLRIGKHQGFLSTTINILVKEISPKVYSNVYPKLVPKGYKDFPNKSRKITIDKEVLGWCVLSKI